MKAKKADSFESAARLIDSISERFGFCAQGGWAVDCGWVGLGRIASAAFWTPWCLK